MQEKRQLYLDRMHRECLARHKSSRWRRSLDNALQIVVIVGSASLPILLNLAQVPRLLPTLLGILVAVSAALLKYFKFDEWGRIHRQTYLRLDDELEDYQLGTGQYQALGADEAFSLFRRTTALIVNDHVRQVNELHGRSQPAGQTDKQAKP